MDWQQLMAAADQWLWKTPYLDMPNYAWVASGFALLTLALYLVMVLTAPKKEREEEEAAGTPGPEIAAPPEPEIAPAPKPEVSRPAAPGAEVKPAPAPEAAAPEKAAPAPVREKPAPAPRPAPAPPPPKPAAPPPPPPPPAKKVEEAVPEEVELEPPEGWLTRLKKGLSKTQSRLAQGLERLLVGAINAETMEELEELLITSDLGVKTSMALLTRLSAAVKSGEVKEGAELRAWLKSQITGILTQVERPLAVPAGQAGPYVIMVTGVNGTGKTTTIGKLALRFRREGKSVLIGAADTFRAAAIQQLEVWAGRAGCQVVAHQEGADPSAVAFDAIKAAVARKVDVLIIDTAGRLHTKVNLMEELKKVKRITGRELPGAPHETLLVLDATTGQNAVQQAKMFNEALQVTGLVLTKLDGTAKGGIIVAISDEFKIPIRFIGVGEKIYDLQPFDAGRFAEALFS
ncbi:MAG TPA: signal recognition particle-docking protein FtsY [bacterium]|nr:signal recognition particle-docking protein FtsY [bacterium]